MISVSMVKMHLYVSRIHVASREQRMRAGAITQNAVNINGNYNSLNQFTKEGKGRAEKNWSNDMHAWGFVISWNFFVSDSY